MARIDNFSDIEIKYAITNSNSWAGICKILNITDNSYNRERLKEFIELNSLDISHFVTKLSKQEYETNPKLCKFCGNPISWEQHTNEYCSHSCATSATNYERAEKKYCLNCGKEITHKNANKYCSSDCQFEYKQKNYIKRWKEGLETGLSGKYGISDRIRKYLMDKYNCSCQKCGWNKVHPITGNVPLQIHHIDGDCTNNKEENLQLLCPNCHALTENYGNLNKNATRVDERKR